MRAMILSARRITPLCAGLVLAGLLAIPNPAAAQDVQTAAFTKEIRR